jgi:hypothetical protein
MGNKQQPELFPAQLHNSDDGGSKFLRNVVKHQTTRSNIPEDNALQSKVLFASTLSASSSSSSSSAKEPFFSHSLPQKILSDLIRFSLHWISQQYFLLQSKVVSLTSNSQRGGPGLCIYLPQ